MNHPPPDDALIPASELPPPGPRGTPPTEEYRRARADGLLQQPMTLEDRQAARKQAAAAGDGAA